jgi:2-(3-amino-3-carboxypropyl)histidine synthase
MGISIPQVKPLSAGEVLGCTSPTLTAHMQHDPTKTTTHNNDTNDNDHPPPQKRAVVCFVADGRFHLESTMIANPHIDTFYRYDPYSRVLSEEQYDYHAMHQLRQNAIHVSQSTFSNTNNIHHASSSSSSTTTTTTMAITTNKKQVDIRPVNDVIVPHMSSTPTVGIIMGTLGRQGNPAIVQRIQQLLRARRYRYFLVLLSEITPFKLTLLNRQRNVHVWVQVACPRLSIDWGQYLSGTNQPPIPVLSPYELFVALDETQWTKDYPMDYYSSAGGPWSNYYESNKNRQLIDTSKCEK